MTMITVAALAFSVSLIALLCRGDPKRRRANRLPGDGQGAGTRRLLAAVACLPGVGLALIGDAAAFLIWLGGCAVAGWFIALAFGQAGKRIL